VLKDQQDILSPVVDIILLLEFSDDPGKETEERKGIKEKIRSAFQQLVNENTSAFKDTTRCCIEGVFEHYLKVTKKHQAITNNVQTIAEAVSNIVRISQDEEFSRSCYQMLQVQRASDFIQELSVQLQHVLHKNSPTAETLIQPQIQIDQTQIIESWESGSATEGSDDDDYEDSASDSCGTDDEAGWQELSVRETERDSELSGSEAESFGSVHSEIVDQEDLENECQQLVFQSNNALVEEAT